MRPVPDAVLVAEAQLGDELAAEQLVIRCRPMVEILARKYFMVGNTWEDVLAEGLVGLVKAIKSFRPDRNSGFRNFASIVITRQIVTAVRFELREKHLVHHQAISVDADRSVEDTDTGNLLDVLPDRSDMANDPFEVVHARQSLRLVVDTVNRLSDLERIAMKGFVNGDSYEDIAVAMGRPVKHVDNAIQRGKRKIRLALQEAA